MDTSEGTPIRESSLARDLLNAGRYYLGGRRGLLLLAGTALAAGLAFDWSWLVAAGIAPLLLTALPCVAMCALGLCMTRMGNRSCSGAPESASGNRSNPEPDEPAPAAPEPLSIGSERPEWGPDDAAMTMPGAQPQHSDERSTTHA